MGGMVCISLSLEEHTLLERCPCHCMRSWYMVPLQQNSKDTVLSPTPLLKKGDSSSSSHEEDPAVSKKGEESFKKHSSEDKEIQRLAQYIRAAGQLARQAIADFQAQQNPSTANPEPLRVAGALPPLGPSYRPDLVEPDDNVYEFIPFTHQEHFTQESTCTSEAGLFPEVCLMSYVWAEL